MCHNFLAETGGIAPHPFGPSVFKTALVTIPVQSPLPAPRIELGFSTYEADVLPLDEAGGLSLPLR